MSATAFVRHIGAAIFASGLVLMALRAHAQSRPLKPFTVAEGIGVAHFLDPFYSEAAMVSPNGHFVALEPAERGLLKSDLVEDDLRVYDLGALEHFVLHAHQSGVPSPLLELRESTYKEGPVISQVEWLADSSGLAFLLKDAQGKNQLELMRLRQKAPSILSVAGQDVTAFDVRDSAHYAYTVFSPGSSMSPTEGPAWTALVGTGHYLLDLLNPSAELARVKGEGAENGMRSVLWAAVGAPPHIVISSQTDRPIVINPIGRWLALAPNGHTLATAVTVQEVPELWVRRFRPDNANDPQRMHAGYQNLDQSISPGAVSEYVLINVQTGGIRPVNGAPTGIGNGWWWSIGGPVWSDDGKAVLLPNAYPQPRAGELIDQPCVAIFYPATDNMRCLKRLRSPSTEKGAHGHDFFLIGPVGFVDHKSDKVIMHYLRNVDQAEAPKAELYVRSLNGKWQVTEGRCASEACQNYLNVYVKQGLNMPPVAVAADRDTGASRVFWDPNPQLRNIALGRATVYHWKDAIGRSWTGGLYKPANYETGRRYPLVIQTHGFSEVEFRPSGIYPTAFAARALASSGIIVLQTPMMCALFGTREGPCNVAGYEGAVKQLSSEGIVDPDRVGIVGFSRTAYYALEALTTSRVRFAAGSVTDGANFGYMQYLTMLDTAQDAEARDADAVIGAKPFGSGLSIWIKRSPEFNLQRSGAPLFVVALGRLSLLYMWEPYAALRYLGKPVELSILNSDEHVLTNPAVRMASQGGTVDWFRFWLQGYEDPNPAKAGQYRRWEKLCDMQVAQNPGSPKWCVPSEVTNAKSHESERGPRQ